MVSERSKRKALPARGAAMVGGKRLTSVFDEVSVLHARGARWLAAAALNTRFHKSNERIVYWSFFVKDGAHRRDASTWRQTLFASSAIRGAMRQA
jgi:hypothetical protein